MSISAKGRWIPESWRISMSDVAKVSLHCCYTQILLVSRDAMSRVKMPEAGKLTAKGIEARVQDDPAKIPFQDSEFDFLTAVCVYHHVPPSARAALTREMCRVFSAPAECFPSSNTIRTTRPRASSSAGHLSMRTSYCCRPANHVNFCATQA